jgi:hypothetical protein
MKRQLAANGDYSSTAICQTNIPAIYQSIFGIFHGTSTFLFISSTISCGAPKYVLQNAGWEAPMQSF